MSFFEQLALFRLEPETRQPRERHVQLGAQIDGYTLRQARRRLSMTIDERGLRVAAPRSIRIAEVEEFLRSNAEWVIEKLAEYASVSAPRHIAIRAGAKIPLIDGEATVEVLPGSNRVRWLGDTLILEARPNASLEVLARRGLQRRAMDVFSERLALYAGRMEIVPPPLALSSARTRWGSCSHESGVRLN